MDDSNKVMGQSTNNYSPEINVPPIPSSLPSEPLQTTPNTNQQQISQTPVSNEVPGSDIQPEPVKEQPTQLSSEPSVLNPVETPQQVLNVHHNPQESPENTFKEGTSVSPEPIEQKPPIQEEIPIEQEVKVKDKSTKKFPILLLILIALALIIGGYFVAKQYLFTGENANRKNGDDTEGQGLIVVQNDGTAPKADKTSPEDICISELQSILSMIKQFEEYQKEKDASSVLSLFTKPESTQEKAELANLDGSDSGLPPRLYNNVSTNYLTDSYSVISNPLKTEKSGVCNVIIEELRAYYGGPENPEYSSPLAKSFTLVVKKVDEKWMIVSYQSSEKNIKESKYSGFLMETKD